MIRSTSILVLLLKLSVLTGQDRVVENAFLHVSTTNAISGESIYFSAYTYQEPSGKLSDLSRLLYVELVDENGESRLKAKLEMIEGRGEGKMFVPVSLETGIYRLVAYTRWMQNDQSFFEQPIAVLNPYRSYKTASDTAQSKYQPLRINEMLWKDSLAAYEPLSLVQSEIVVPGPASLSITISKVHELQYENKFASPTELTTTNHLSASLIPEYQYGIIQGSTNSPNTWITASFQASEMEIDAVKTNENGDFKIIYNPSNMSTGLGSLRSESNDLKDLTIFPDYYEKYSAINTALVLKESDLKEVEQRSIYNQLMNAYQDPIVKTKKGPSQFIPSDLTKSYLLDEYKRFGTMRDTFIELIFEVAASKNEENNSLMVRSEYIDRDQNEKEPLVLLDGIQVTPSVLLAISPYLVEEIKVLTTAYFIGGYSYNGIISVHTFKGDLASQKLEEVIPLRTPLTVSTSSPFRQIEAQKTRHPHFETLLYFDPNLKHVGGPINLEFMTSNNRGVYQVSVKGISDTGEKVNVVQYFVVE